MISGAMLIGSGERQSDPKFFAVDPSRPQSPEAVRGRRGGSGMRL